MWRLDAAVGAESLSKDASVLAKRLRVLLGAELMQQLGRALHVGEEKRDGAGREVAHRANDRARARSCLADWRIHWRAPRPEAMFRLQMRLSQASS